MVLRLMYRSPQCASVQAVHDSAASSHRLVLLVAMKGSNKGQAAVHPNRRERSRSHGAPAFPEQLTKGGSKGTAAAPADGRGGSRSRDVASQLPDQICCRDPMCVSRVFEVFVVPNRTDQADLICVECGTATASDLARRLIYARTATAVQQQRT